MTPLEEALRLSFYAAVAAVVFELLAVLAEKKHVSRRGRGEEHRARQQSSGS